MLTRTPKSIFSEENKVIFDNQKTLFKLLLEFKKNPHKFNEFGNWTKKIQYYNHFQDWDGNKRIGNYINDCLRMFDQSLDKDIIINKANNKYKKRWKLL